MRRRMKSNGRHSAHNRRRRGIFFGLELRHVLSVSLLLSHSAASLLPSLPPSLPVSSPNCRAHPWDPSARINQFSIPGEIIQILLHLQPAAARPPRLTPSPAAAKSSFSIPCLSASISCWYSGLFYIYISL